MKYKYIFNSPVKYSVTSDDKDFNDIEDTASKLDINVDIIKIANKLLKQKTKNFIELMNNTGIIDIQFNINKDTLNTLVVMDHRLRVDEFKKLYTDIQSQLMAGLGKTIGNISLLEFNDNIEYTNDKGITGYKPVVKNVYCLLWQYDDWKLKFISDCR